MLALAFIAGASPASAAVTLRGIVPEDGPRAGWLERYTEARQGPEQIEKVSQTYKVGDGAAARPLAPRRRHPRHRRQRLRDQGRRDQARAPSRSRAGQAAARGAARRHQQLQRPRRSPHHLSAPRLVRQQHLGQRRLRDRGAGRRERVAQVDLRRHQRHQRQRRSARRDRQRRRQRQRHAERRDRQDDLRRRHRAATSARRRRWC